MTEFLGKKEPVLRSEAQLTAEQVLNIGSEFLNHFELEADPFTETNRFLAGLKELQPRYQGERFLIRYELEQDQKEWPDETIGVIMDVARGLRMLEDQTKAPETPDAIIVLGGARQSNVDRLLYPIDEGLPRGLIKKPSVVMAGSERKLKDAEKENVQNYAPQAETEVDLCMAAVEKYGSRYQGGVDVVRVYGDKAGTPEVIGAAIDKLILKGVLKTNRGYFESGSVAAVTTQIYQVSTQLDLERVAARDGITNVFTMGNPSDPKVVANRTPATYLSEVVRTLKAAANSVQEKAVVAERNKLQELRDADWTKHNNDPENWTIVHQYEDGRKVIRQPSGDERIVEADGSSWHHFSRQSGLRYDGPDDLIGHHDE